MPNSQNSSKHGNSSTGKGGAKHRTPRASSEKPNEERSDLKEGEHPKEHKGDTSRSSSQGRKTASGGSIDD